MLRFLLMRPSDMCGSYSIGVLGNRGACHRTIGGTRNKQKFVEGTREQLVCFHGNGEHCKRLRKIKFYTGKPD